MNLPDLVIYYNKWRDVDVPEVHECFSPLRRSDLRTIKRGDSLWRQSEPYAYAAGKVYGYERIVVTLTRMDVGRYMEYRSSVSSVTAGSMLVEPGSLYRLTDQAKLEELVRKYGDRITHIHDEELQRELGDLRSMFEAGWDRRGLPR